MQSKVNVYLKIHLSSKVTKQNVTKDMVIRLHFGMKVPKDPFGSKDFKQNWNKDIAISVHFDL